MHLRSSAFSSCVFNSKGVSVRKDTRPLEGLSGVLHLPMYQGPRTLSTTLQPFQVAAVQHHYGESPVTGHYRSLLCGQNRFAEGRSWLTDDGKQAQIMPMDSHELCTVCTIVWSRTDFWMELANGPPDL